MTLDNRATRQQLEKYLELGFCPIHLEGKSQLSLARIQSDQE